MKESGFDSEKLKRYFKGEYSDEDSSYVSNVFTENGSERELKRFLAGQFDQLANQDEMDRNLDHILHKIHYDINTKKEESKRRKLSGLLTWSLRIAALLVLPLAIFWGVKGYLNISTGRETWIELKAPAWTRAQFSLPDGTTGWLNSNSSIKYNGSFNIDRQVILNGEAFFDVVKDKSRPFKVNTNEIIVKVLGTRFNIASYENEKSVEVVLEEGKLELCNKEMTDYRTMNPNDLVIYDKTYEDLKTEIVEPKKYLAWTEGKLVFRNDPVDVIARRLERWYNIDVEIRGNVSEDIRLRATFIDENLEEVLGLLKRSLPIDYTIENRDIKPDDSYAKKKVIISVRPI
jgi:transmembrane sensor